MRLPLLPAALAAWGTCRASAVLQLGAARLARAGTGRAVRAAGELPSCSCDCCDVTERRPDEVLAGVRVKCTPSHTHSSDVCGEQCSGSDGDPLLGDSAWRGLDYQQFCFYECKPADGVMSFVGTQCIAFDVAELNRISDGHGNPRDPATLYSGQPQVDFEHPCNSAALLSKSHTVKAGSEPAAAEFSAEKAKEVTDAVDVVIKGKVQAQTQRKETQKAIDNVLKMQGNFMSSNPLAAVQDIQAAVARSGEAKDAAMQYARKAVATLRASQGKMWRSALGAADLQMQRMREEAHAAAEAAANKPKPWREYAAEAAAAASKPYLDAVQNAQQSAQLWHVGAVEAAREAHDTEVEAEALRAQSVKLQASGQDEESVAAVAQAKELDSKSQSLFTRAQQMVVTAKEAAASANGYYAIAQEAARRAGVTATLPPTMG